MSAPTLHPAPTSTHGPHAPAPSTVRTYGGWRRTRGIGLFGLGAGPTALVLACVVVPLVATGMSLRAGLVAAVPCALLASLALLRVDGVPLVHVGLRRAQWAWASSRGYPQLRAGVVVEHPSAWQLPGALAATRLLSVEDGRGGTFGLVHDTNSGLMTATLRCAATSTWLVDAAAADAWVANWHAWLASRGFDPLVAWVAVTVESAPEPGSTLARAVTSRLHSDAPADAARLMRELVARSPAAAADVTTRVSVTFDPSRAADRLPSADERAAEVSRSLAGMETALAECGVTVLGRASAGDLVAAVRTAYDPAARGDVQDARRLPDVGNVINTADPSDASNPGDSDVTSIGAPAKGLLTWGDAGPVAAVEEWGCYRHDSGVSVSWAWHEAPRQQVPATVLTRLVSPGRWPKRVTLVLRPMPAATAARLLEGEVNAAAFRDAYRRTQGRDATARDVADRERAVAAAREEALGAGVVLASLYATVTVPVDGVTGAVDPAAVSAAVADVESRADQSKIRLRRLWGSQAAGFTTTLPAGVYPAHLAGRVLR